MLNAKFQVKKMLKLLKMLSKESERSFLLHSNKVLLSKVLSFQLICSVK
jgi:hypothetical protein